MKSNMIPIKTSFEDGSFANFSLNSLFRNNEVSCDGSSLCVTYNTGSAMATSVSGVCDNSYNANYNRPAAPSVVTAVQQIDSPQYLYSLIQTVNNLIKQKGCASQRSITASLYTSIVLLPLPAQTATEAIPLNTVLNGTLPQRSGLGINIAGGFNAAQLMGGTTKLPSNLNAMDCSALVQVYAQLAKQYNASVQATNQINGAYATQIVPSPAPVPLSRPIPRGSGVCNVCNGGRSNMAVRCNGGRGVNTGVVNSNVPQRPSFIQWLFNPRLW